MDALARSVRRPSRGGGCSPGSAAMKYLTQCRHALGAQEVPEGVVPVGCAGAEEDEVHDPLEPAGVLRLVNSEARFFAKGLAPRRARSFSAAVCRTSAGPERLAVLPKLTKNFSELFEKPGSWMKTFVIPGAALFRSVNVGVRLVGERRAVPPRARADVGRREQLEVLFEFAPVGGGGLGDLVAFDEEVGDVLAPRANGARALSESTASWPGPCSAGEDRQHPDRIRATRGWRVRSLRGDPSRGPRGRRRVR